MNFFFLKYFCDTVRYQSVTEAAIKNNVSQSAISQGISQLEKSLKISLLTHKRNSIKVTDAGKLVFDWSKSLFISFENLKERLKENVEAYEGSLCFACSHSLGLSILPNLLAEFKKMAPKVAPKVIFGHTGLIKEWIKQGEIEFGLVLDNDDLSAFSLTKIYSGAFYFFRCSKKFQDEVFTSALFPPARFEVHMIKKLFFEKFGFELKSEMEICSWEVIARLIALTQSVGFLPDYVAFDPLKKLVKAHPDLFIPYTLYAAYPQGEMLSQKANLFLAAAQKLFKKSMVEKLDKKF